VAAVVVTAEEALAASAAEAPEAAALRETGKIRLQTGS
jgi:hypothetical protein